MSYNNSVKREATKTQINQISCFPANQKKSNKNISYKVFYILDLKEK